MKSQNNVSIDVDKLSEQISIEQLASQLGISPDELIHAGDEVRLPCRLAGCEHCDQTGGRVIAVLKSHRAKLWKCHHYAEGQACGKQGNLVSLISLSLGGPLKPRGEDFRRAAQAIEQLVLGETTAPTPDPDNSGENPVPASQPKQNSKKKELPKENVALEEHENERVRAIADLHRKLTLDIASMPPHASKYVRARPFLSESLSAERYFGYLPSDTGGDRSGGTQRGKFVYAMKNRQNQVVTYFGRDTDWERKYTAWIANHREGREPAKFHFVKGYARGLDLYGAEKIRPEIVGESLRRIGLPVVEGPNDVLNLIHNLRVHAVGLCSNQATQTQIERIAELAHSVAGGVITLLLDCDDAGDQGADAFCLEASKHARVQRAWSQSMYDGRFAGRQPESLTMPEAKELKRHLTRRRS